MLLETRFNKGELTNVVIAWVDGQLVSIFFQGGLGAHHHYILLALVWITVGMWNFLGLDLTELISIIAWVDI